MASKPLKPQGEMSGKRLGDPDLGLKAKWAGSGPGPDVIASVSKMDRGTGATRRKGNDRPTKSVNVSGPSERKGYGAAHGS